MKQTILAIALLFGFYVPLSAQRITKADRPTKKAISLDWLAIKGLAEQAPLEARTKHITEGLRIQLPNEQGGTEEYFVLESPIMSKDFAQEYPDMQTYILQHASNPRITGRMLTTATYMHVVLLDGQGITLIQPDDLTNPEGYSIGTFDDDSDPSATEDVCTQWGDRLQLSPQVETRSGSGFTNETRRTYNLAIVTTGEFHDANGGTVAAATAVVTASVNAIQAIFDRELSIRFTLLTPMVYDDYTIDPFDPASAVGRFDQAAAAVATNFASGDYDIGHAFHDSDQAPALFAGGGVAYRPAVCSNGTTPTGTGLFKGGGWSGSFDNTISSWYRLAAHEFGHMFGARHTFNGSGSSCAGSNHSTTSAYEIGSGTTIMSYRGICSAAQNIPTSGPKDYYFHANSLDEMISHITGAGACGTTTVTGNTAPVGDASPTGMTYTIPRETPFTLTGSGSDTDGDALTYVWEQFDEDGAGRPTQGFTGGVAAASTLAPLFRSLPPSDSPVRSFPELDNILAGTNSGVTFEALSAVSRTLNFVLTTRDNNALGGGAHCDATTVAVDATTGPFEVSSQNGATTWIADGTTTATITWNVAGTTGGSVNCANVDILFSTDGGVTFPAAYTIATATPNDGTHTFTIPSFPTSAGRIKIQCSDNIFFDINNVNIVLSSSCGAEGTMVSPSTSVSETAGSPNLDLALTSEYGTSFTTYSESLESTDELSELIYDDGSGVCTSGFNDVVINAYSFKVDQVDTYTFTRTTGAFGLIMHLYAGGFNSGSLCSNWVASSAVYNSGTGFIDLFNSFSSTLIPNVAYTLVVTSFSPTLPSPIPSPYTITFSSAGSGATSENVQDPGAAFSYTYVMVDNATGLIEDINAGSDLSSSSIFSAGDYSVYGLSYLSTENLAPYIAGDFSTLQSDLSLLVICGNLSKNLVAVTVTAPLPVEFLSFEAEATELDQVQLTWNTAQEVNNDYFELERRGEQGEFRSIANIDGKGNSQAVQAYSFLDRSPTSNKLWYRLKQVDIDGGFSYSEIREVNLTGQREQYLMFPNPARDMVTLVPPATLLDTKHQVNLYDLQGKLVLEQQTEAEANIELDISTLPTGLYILRVRSDKGKARILKLAKE